MIYSDNPGTSMPLLLGGGFFGVGKWHHVGFFRSQKSNLQGSHSTNESSNLKNVTFIYSQVGQHKNGKKKVWQLPQKEDINKKTLHSMQTWKAPKVRNSLNTTNLEIRTNKTQKQAKHLQRTKEMTPIAI